MNHSISVIIPTFQHARTLQACLDSVLSQTRKPEEIIVVDDGSTDDTQQVLREYKALWGLGTPPITIIAQANQGAPTARTSGFASSTGAFVIFCDADVVMQPKMLETLAATLETHPEASFAYSSFKWGWKIFPSFAFDEARLKQMNYIHTSALIRREAFPLFDPALKRFQDWDLWLTMLEQNHRGIFVNQILYSVIQEERPERMSNWLPSLVIRFPWNLIGWKPERVRKYEEAKAIIFKKHHLV